MVVSVPHTRIILLIRERLMLLPEVDDPDFVASADRFA